MFEFLKHYDKYEYAAKDGKHLAASLCLSVLNAILLVILAVFVTIIGVKVCAFLGVFGW